MLRRSLVGLALAAAALAVIAVAGAGGPPGPMKPVNRPVYSALLDYEAGWAAAANPNGVWSYGWSKSLTAPLVLYTRAYVPSVDNGLCHFWDDPAQTRDYAPAVSRNSGGDYDDGNVTFTAGRLALHHGDGGTYSHVIFKAPSLGLYTVAATFFAQQNGIDADVNVLVNGKLKFSDGITSNGETRSFGKLFVLKAGQTVDFAVGPNGDVKLHAGWIGLEAVITGGLSQPD